MPATGPPGKPILELVLGGRLTGAVLFTGTGGGLNALARGRKLLKIEGELVKGAMLPVKGRVEPPTFVFLGIFFFTNSKEIGKFEIISITS